MINCRNINEVKNMLQKNYDINTQDKYGQTILHKAVVYNDINFIKELLKINGINGRIKDKNGQTPIFYSNKNNAQEIIKLFQEKYGPIVFTDYNNKHENIFSIIDINKLQTKKPKKP